MINIFDLFRKNTEDRKDGPMKIIAGLGNPTDKYKGTRHNIGFMAIDRLAKDQNVSVNNHKFKAMTASCFLGGQKVLLMKPLTFMNLSGESIRMAADFFKIDPEDVLIIYDDISLEPGMLRIRKKGSAGGHNGMKSIINHLGSDAFPRIRVGIGGDRHPDMDLADYVLSRFQGEEAEAIDQALDKAVKAAELFASDQLDEAMNLYSVGKKKRGGKKKKRQAAGDQEVEKNNVDGQETDKQQAKRQKTADQGKMPVQAADSGKMPVRAADPGKKPAWEADNKEKSGQAANVKAGSEQAVDVEGKSDQAADKEEKPGQAQDGSNPAGEVIP